MSKVCERCRAKPPAHRMPGGGWSESLLDYCRHCSRDLCEACMALGCCGRVPAESGMEADD